MSEQKCPKTERELIEALADLFEEIPPETGEEADEVLRDAGLDPELVAKNMREFAEGVLAKSPLNWRNRAEHERAEAKRRLRGFESSMPSDRQGLLAEVSTLLERVRCQHQGLVAVEFRQFEESSEEDLRSLLAELRYLESVQSSREPTGS